MNLSKLINLVGDNRVKYLEISENCWEVRFGANYDSLMEPESWDDSPESVFSVNKLITIKNSDELSLSCELVVYTHIKCDQHYTIDVGLDKYVFQFDVKCNESELGKYVTKFDEMARHIELMTPSKVLVNVQEFTNYIGSCLPENKD